MLCLFEPWPGLCPGLDSWTRHMVYTKHERSIFGHEYALNTNRVWHNQRSGNPAHRSSHTSGKIKTELSWPLFLCTDTRGILS